MKIIITSFFILSCLFARPVLANLLPNDPFYSNQWYLSRIGAEKAWSKISSTPNTVIAVIDSGVQIDHPDLKANIWKNEKEVAGDGIDNDGNGFIDDVNGWDFASNTPDPSPKLSDGWTEAGVSHGTLVAGIIAAEGNNKKGVSGLTWKAQIMPLKALNDRGEGKVSDVIRAIDYAINNGAHIINFSFTSLNYSEGLQEAIYRAHQAGIMIVAAAGNEQASGQGYDIDETRLYPACYDGRLIGENMVIGVAATDALDQKTTFSSYGSACVDISAPGISFYNTVTNFNVVGADKYYDGYFSGTSLAAPLVTATLALISEANPELDRREIVNILFATSDNINAINPAYTGKLGNGRLNVDKAVAMAKEKLYSRLGRLIVVPMGESQDNQGSEINGAKVSASNGDLVYKLPIDEMDLGASFVTGDINGDSLEDIAFGVAPGKEPLVKIYNHLGKLITQFLAYEKDFRGGVNIALADFDNDGRQEIIVAPASNGRPEIKIFDNNGNLKNTYTVIDGFWRGGLNVATGNIDGRGEPEIIVSFAKGNEPQIRILSAKGNLLGIFLAYEKNFRGGVNIA
ncbi:MAG TPA: S8 family serine peptidase, partial [Patescibacteria group bacterium]|nr:S8 family serine peptidase [Patescibacteria group bacterium]